MGPPLFSLSVAQGPDVTGVFLQYGALGAIALILAFAVRVLYARVDEDRAYHRARADRLEEELRSLNVLVRGEYIATIARSTEAISDFIASQRGQ